MKNRIITSMLLAAVAGITLITPVSAQYWNDSYYVNPGYNNYAYRGYAPYDRYGYSQHHYYNGYNGNGYYRDHTLRNVAIGAGIGAAVGLLVSHHGHRYNY